MPQPRPRPAGRSTLRDVAIGISALHAIFYVVSVAGFLHLQGAMDNRFTEIARSDYLGFILFKNLKLFFGYLAVAALHVLVLHPVVGGVAGRWELGRWTTRIAAVAASLTMSILVAFGVATSKPFLLAGPVSRFYWRSHRATPDFIRDVVYTPTFFSIVFWTAVTLLSLHYLRESFRWLGRHPRLAKKFVGAALATAIVLLVLRGLPSHARTEGGGGPGGDRRWNVLILASDSLRGDHLGVNGYHRPTSPEIDRLAAEGVNLGRCLTPIASTLEGWLTILTGQYPHTHGMRHMFPSKEEAETAAANPVLLPRVLGDLGYHTAVISDWAGNNFRLVDYGFDEVKVRHVQNFEVFLTEAVMMSHPLILAYFQNDIGHNVFPELEILTSNRTPDQVTDEVIETIDDAQAEGEPFFVVGFYSTTHLPYSTKYPYYELFTDPAYDGPNKTEIEFQVDEFITHGFDHGLPQAEMDHIRNLYDGTVRQFDDEVAEVVAHLRRIGALENTIVIVTSDHGDDLYEPGTTLGHGISFNGGDQTNHIPVVFRLPGRAHAGTRIDHLTRSIDIVPTLLDLMGVEPAARMDGVTLAPWIRDPSTPDPGLVFYGETSYLFFRHEIPGEKLLPLDTLDVTTRIDPEFGHNIVLTDEAWPFMLASKERCIRTPEWKLVTTPGDGYTIERLFHLPTDPHCERNVARENPEVLRTLRGWLERWAGGKGEVRVHPDGRVEE